MKKENKVVISFCTTPEVARRLKRQKNVSEFLTKLLAKIDKVCLICGSKVR